MEPFEIEDLTKLYQNRFSYVNDRINPSYWFLASKLPVPSKESFIATLDSHLKLFDVSDYQMERRILYCYIVKYLFLYFPPKPENRELYEKVHMKVKDSSNEYYIADKWRELKSEYLMRFKNEAYGSYPELFQKMRPWRAVKTRDILPNFDISIRGNIHPKIIQMILDNCFREKVSEALIDSLVEKDINLFHQLADLCSSLSIKLNSELKKDLEKHIPDIKKKSQLGVAHKIILTFRNVK